MASLSEGICLFMGCMPPLPWLISSSNVSRETAMKVFGIFSFGTYPMSAVWCHLIIGNPLLLEPFLYWARHNFHFLHTTTIFYLVGQIQKELWKMLMNVEKTPASKLQSLLGKYIDTCLCDTCGCCSSLLDTKWIPSLYSISVDWPSHSTNCAHCDEVSLSYDQDDPHTCPGHWVVTKLQ